MGPGFQGSPLESAKLSQRPTRRPIPTAAFQACHARRVTSLRAQWWVRMLRIFFVPLYLEKCFPTLDAIWNGFTDFWNLLLFECPNTCTYHYVTTLAHWLALRLFTNGGSREQTGSRTSLL